jgi:hypothetical protein
MILLVLILFMRTSSVSFRSLLLPARPNYQALVLVLFWVMPLFSFLGLWDAYLSAALYSGNTLEAHLIVSEPVRDRLPPEAQAQARLGPDGWEVDLSTWCSDETNVPAYPARRCFLAVAEQVRALAGGPNGVVLVVRERPHWRSQEREETRWVGREVPSSAR